MEAIFNTNQPPQKVRENRTWIVAVKHTKGTQKFFQFNLPQEEANTKSNAMNYFIENKLKKNEDVIGDGIFNLDDYQSKHGIPREVFMSAITKR